MIKLIQDYKNWKSARVEYKDAKRDWVKYINSIVTEVDYKQLPDMLDSLHQFHESLPKDKSQPDYVQAYEDSIKTCRSPSCIYRIVYKLPNDDCWKGRYLFKANEFNRCINNRVDGKISEELCDGCSYFKELVEFQALTGKVENLKKERQIAKQKFFGNFVFWKSNAK